MRCSRSSSMEKLTSISRSFALLAIRRLRFRFNPLKNQYFRIVPEPEGLVNLTLSGIKVVIFGIDQLCRYAVWRAADARRCTPIFFVSIGVNRRASSANYSSRSATVGSKFDARIAGIQHAIADTAKKNTIIEANVTGSVGLTPISMVAMRRVSPTAAKR